MTINEKNLINNTHNDIIMYYQEQCNLGIYEKENIDLNNPIAEGLYNHYIDNICSSNALEFFKNDFAPKETKEITDKTVQIICYIFGEDNFILNEIKNFFQSLIVTPTDLVMDGLCLKGNLKENTNTPYYAVKIPPLTDESVIICLVHEFIHYHCLNNNIDMNRKKYYEEILSIYGEKMALYLLEKESNTTDLTRKIENIRLGTIKWHYIDHIAEIEQIKNFYQYLCKMNSIPHSGVEESKKEFENNYPWVKSKKGIETFELYDKIKRESYGIGYLYSENLFQKYLNDKKQLSKMQSVLKGNTYLQDLLNYYNIIADNKDIYIPVEQKIKRLT